MAEPKTMWFLDEGDSEPSIEELIKAAQEAFPGVPLCDIMVHGGESGQGGGDLVGIDKRDESNSRHRKPTPPT